MMEETLKGQKKLRLIVLVIAFCMTGTPIGILANRIDPYVLQMPFFLFWNIIWPFITYLAAVWYGKAADQYEDLMQAKEDAQERS